MKETTLQKIRLIKRFYNDILKTTLKFFIIACFIVIIISTWRFNFFAYLLAFFISFGSAFVICFLKKESRQEFLDGEI